MAMSLPFVRDRARALQRFFDWCRLPQMLDRPALVIHGHFYQPPRENPWTGIVDREPSAAPLHDWNERIHQECYRPNGFARIHDDGGGVVDVVNNYERMSFNFGPTLLGWLERHHPRTYRRILDADRKSRARRGGHGNAIAQAYNHAILPLCNDRDLRTQVRWGLGEFRQRFGRPAEALWLPETAADDRTLNVLAAEGMRYALLAPSQAARVRDAGGQWRDVAGGGIDPRRPYRWTSPDGSGRSLTLFFYDAGVARAIAFEGALHASHALLDRCSAAAGGAGSVVHAATDGESYGHHFKHGERCLAYSLAVLAERRGFWVTNYGELCDHLGPAGEVALARGEEGLGTSWSCAHGVGRWLRDCGCQTGGKPGWNQRWRAPLRTALDLLRDAAAELFEAEAGALATDPWALRDDYIELMVASPRGSVDVEESRTRFFERHARRPLGEAERERVLALLEMQRSSLLMYTSCGWFFNDLAGIETVQILRYAGRLVDQMRALGAEPPEARLLEVLAEARSNRPEAGSGADLWRREVASARVTPASLAAHVYLRALPDDAEPPFEGDEAGHHWELHHWRKGRQGRLAVATAKLLLREHATGTTHAFSGCAVDLGSMDLRCVLGRFPGDEAYARACERLWAELDRGSILPLLRVAEEAFGPDEYGVAHVLPSARAALSEALFGAMRQRYLAQNEAIYQDALPTIGMFVEAGLPLPEELRLAAELALRRHFDAEIAAAPLARFDAGAYQRALAIAEQARRWGCELGLDAAKRRFDALLERLLYRVCAGAVDDEHAGSEPTATALELLALGERLGLSLDLERAQEQLQPIVPRGAAASEPLRRLLVAVGFSPRLTAG
jgi:alpha-amylase/alpha-mannosidase (GH57 family)